VVAELIHSSESLSGDYDEEEDARSMPKGFRVKGMFFSRLVEELGGGFANVRTRLSDPPRDAYVAFRDYPSSDYTRVMAAAARRRYPDVGLREASRRLARDDMHVFGASTLGRVVLSVVGDARGALLKTPFVFEKLAPGEWRVDAHDVDARTVRIEFVPLYGRWEYTLGQLEGIVLHYEPATAIRVEELPNQHFCFDVRHTA
jgi:hypothetical protein